MAALATVGLDQLAAVRADRLQHSELRFVEIARALMLRPAFLLLDEPAAGLSADEIKRLGDLIVAISRAGTGVLLVEHHADLIFDICDRVTVLNLGKVLAAGNARRNPFASGGGQCLPRRLRCARDAAGTAARDRRTVGRLRQDRRAATAST